MPVKDKLHVQVNGMKENLATFYLVAMNGQSMYLGSKALSNGQGSFTYNISDINLLPGMYALKVLAGNQAISKKIIYSGTPQ